MNVKEALILKQMAVRKMVVDMALPEKTIEKVLEHAFKGAFKAFRENGSVEISGFGKFVMRKKNTEFHKQRYYNQLASWRKDLEGCTDETVIRKRNLWIAKVEGYLESIKRLEHED